MRKVATAAWVLFLGPLLVSAQPTLTPGAPAQMVITLGHYYGHDPVLLKQDDLTVMQRYEPLSITNLIPLRGDRAGLELFFLVDNCSSCEVDTKFDELRRFIESQPSTTALGVAYIQDGMLQVAEKPTQDRARVVKALNPPTGSKPANPFRALTDLIKGWDQDASRRAVLMISNGIDPTATEGKKDPFAEAAIEAAQRAGVTVYVIYHPSADYLTADPLKLYAGQVQLAHVANETGGEAYFLSFGPLPSLAPFLADIADHFANQYFVEFLAHEGEPNSLQEVRVKSKIPGIDLMAPNKAWVLGQAETNP